MAVAAKAHTAPTDISHILGMGSQSIKNFTAIPEEIQAIQFADWSSAVDIFSFADGFMFVPRGFEHRLRKPEEFDRGTGKLLENAPEFLVFKTDQGEYRIDLGFWVVKKSTGDVHVYQHEQIKSHYVENQF